MSIKERFSEFKNPNYFSRIDNNHILELHIGLDENCRKAIELRANFVPKKINGTTCIEVNQYHKSSYNTLRFSLIDNDISGLYYKFCDDLIEQTRDLRDESEGYQAIVNRFFQWKKLFVNSKRRYLTEPEIMGLIGEILFLKGNLCERIGLSNALKSWSGQELTRKDFSYKDSWFEIKTISRGNQTVKISSLEQLDSENDGELVVFTLEKMSSAYNGITLNNLILEVKELFENIEEKEEFVSKVTLQGYEYSNYYDDFVYELVNLTRYLVDKNFPKLIRKNLPIAIRKTIYELSLIDIMNFEIKS